MSEKRKDHKGRILRTGESQRKDLIYQYRYKDVQGNAMENAVEACLRQGVEDPFINLMIKQHRSTLLIQIENRCPPEAFPTKEEGRPGSAKKGRSRGYGLSSMEMIVEKYQGSLEYRAKDSIFTLRAVLNIPEEAPVREKTGEEPG